MKSNKGNTNYYMIEIGLDGSVRGYINETAKDVYERFKQISIKMSQRTYYYEGKRIKSNYVLQNGNIFFEYYD